MKNKKNILRIVICALLVLILVVGAAVFIVVNDALGLINRVGTEESTLSPEELESILGQMYGVGRIKVLLTESDSAQTIYQTDEDRSQSADSENIRVQTVIVTNSGREEVGLIRSVTPPVYLGAIIVCQGGDNPSVKLAVVQAVSNVTGIPSDRITVLKMK